MSTIDHRKPTTLPPLVAGQRPGYFGIVVDRQEDRRRHRRHCRADSAPRLHPQGNSP